MGKVTGKLQITLPKHLAEEHGIRVGDEVAFESAGDRIVIAPAGARRSSLPVADRLASFDQATERQRIRSRSRKSPSDATGRGWTRDELYDRTRPR